MLGFISAHPWWSALLALVLARALLELVRVARRRRRRAPELAQDDGERIDPTNAGLVLVLLVALGTLVLRRRRRSRR